jgi:hypothetical protein
METVVTAEIWGCAMRFVVAFIGASIPDYLHSECQFPNSVENVLL